MNCTLAENCITAIRQFVESGEIQQIGSLPPAMRQQILDLIMKNETINKPPCLFTLSTPEFLYGLTSFSTRVGKCNDSKYLRRIASSLATILPDGTTIGFQITGLKLNLYKHRQDERDSTNLRSLLAVIEKCPNLSSLDISFRIGRWITVNDPNADDEEFEHNQILPKIYSLTPNAAGLLNKIPLAGDYQRVLENLEALTLSSLRMNFPITNEIYPMLEFKRLRKLDLSEIRIDDMAWLELMNSFKDTLESLHLEQSSAGLMDHVLPYPLPRLNSLDLSGFIKCGRFFVLNMTKCPRLNFVSLDFQIDGRTNMDWFAPLASVRLNASFDVKLDLSITIHERSDGNRVLDELSRFKTVVSHPRYIKGLKVSFQTWDQRFKTALDHAVDVCENLETFEFHWRYGTAIDPGCVASLLRLFRNPEKASKLRHVVFGKFDATVCDACFENCSSLESLTLCGIFRRFAPTLGHEKAANKK